MEMITVHMLFSCGYSQRTSLDTSGKQHVYTFGNTVNTNSVTFLLFLWKATIVFSIMCSEMFTVHTCFVAVGTVGQPVWAYPINNMYRQLEILDLNTLL